VASDGAAAGTCEALLATARACWRAPASASLTGRGLRRHDAPPEDWGTVAEFLLIPSAARPRLLVPAGAPAAAAESVRRYSHALTAAERLARLVLTIGLRSGAADLVGRDRLRVDAPRADVDGVKSLQRLIGEILGEPVLLSLGVGTPRANRKPVLQAVTRRGRSLAFVKLADSDLTRDLLRSEAAALRRLAERRPAALTVPELLYLGEWEGLGVLVQTALATPALTRPRHGRLPVRAMRGLVDAFDGGRLPVTGTAAWQLMGAASPRIPDEARRALFEEVVSRVADRVGDRELPVGAWHGDWAPWNLAWVGTTVRAWDWERFAEEVPAGLDAVHWALSVTVRRRGWRRALDGLAVTAPAALAEVGVPDAARDAVRLVYLVELARRYLLAASSPVGGPLRATTDAVLEHLARATAVPDLPDLPEWSVL
jgi:hypothetical protein